MAEGDITKYSYPFVACRAHPGPQRSYIVCAHIYTGERSPDFVEMASDEHSGTIACAECCPGTIPEETVRDTFRVVCQGCAIARSLLIHQ